MVSLKEDGGKNKSTSCFKWLPKELQTGNCHQDNRHPSFGTAGTLGERNVGQSSPGGNSILPWRPHSLVWLSRTEMSRSSRSDRANSKRSRDQATDVTTVSRCQSFSTQIQSSPTVGVTQPSIHLSLSASLSPSTGYDQEDIG